MSAILYSNIQSSAEITTGSELYKVTQNKTATVVINATNTDTSDDDIRIAIKDYDKQLEFSYSGDDLDADFSSMNYGEIISAYNVSVSSGDLTGIPQGTELTFSGGATAKVLKSYENFTTTNIVVTADLVDILTVDSMSNFAVDDQLTQNSDVAVIVGLNSTDSKLYVQYTQGGPFLPAGSAVGNILSASFSAGTTLIGEASNSYTGVTGTTSGSGINASFDLTRDVNGDIDSVSVNAAGTGYAVSDTITILGSAVGGTDGVDDVTITVDTIDTPVGGGITSNNSGSATVTAVVNDYESLFFNGLYADSFEMNAGEILKFDISSTSGINAFNIYTDPVLANAYTDGVCLRGGPGTSGSFVSLQVTDTTPNTLYYGDSAYSANNREMIKGNSILTGENRSLLVYDVTGTITSSETFTYSTVEYTTTAVNVGGYGRINRYVSAIDELKVFVDYGSFSEGSLLLSPVSNYYYAIDKIYNLKKEDHIEFDRSVTANTSFQRSAIVLGSEYSIVTYSTSGNTTFNVYGFEE